MNKLVADRTPFFSIQSLKINIIFIIYFLNSVFLDFSFTLLERERERREREREREREERD